MFKLDSNVRLNISISCVNSVDYKVIVGTNSEHQQVPKLPDSEALIFSDQQTVENMVWKIWKSGKYGNLENMEMEFFKIFL